MFDQNNKMTIAPTIEPIITTNMEFNLRPTLSRPVRLGIGSQFKAHDQILHVP
jgi:hypothetical protein